MLEAYNLQAMSGQLREVLVAKQRIAYGPPSRDKALGSLPVVAEFCRRLDIAGIVDRAVPIRDVALLTHGAVIEALVANRLTSPSPLLHVQDWARAWAVEEVFGIDPATLNDDRLGRCLDAVAPHLDGIVGSVGANAIGIFGIDVSRLHWDMTSISLYGTYDDPEEGFAKPRFGHPKDRRPDLKQVQTGLGVAADGAVPVFHRAYDGGAGEVNQVLGAMEALAKLAGRRKFLLVGDSKLVSYVNLAAMITAGVAFIAPASKTYVDAATLAAQNLDVSIPVDYVAQRDQQQGPEARGAWAVSEDAMAIPGPRKADPVLQVRRVFVWSSARAGAAKAARAKKLERASDDLARLCRSLGSRHYPNGKAVDERLGAIATQRRVKAYLKSEVGTDAAGKPTLAWHFAQEALDAEAATDGWYALLTNLDPGDADAGEVLIRYKGQEAVERRYGNFKGPLAVAPMFLKNNRRIEALVSIVCLALLVFCLVERSLRLAIAPESALAGLGVGRATKPTGRLIFSALSGLRLIPPAGGHPATVPQPSALQARILELLGVDPTRPR
jgi:transposase